MPMQLIKIVNRLREHFTRSSVMRVECFLFAYINSDRRIYPNEFGVSLSKLRVKMSRLIGQK